MEKNCEVKPRPKTVKEFFRSWYFWKPFIATVIGMIAGFLYYFYIGCSSGRCPITSSPYMSVILGGFMGFFIVNSPCASGKC
jgi:hypothetical protein